MHRKLITKQHTDTGKVSSAANTYEAAVVLGDSGEANVDSIRQNFDSIHCCYVSRSFIN